MTGMADHAKQAPRRDHLWVLVIIAGCALLEVWASWVTIGSLSNFPKIGKLSTDWTLAVTTEAYWGYALYSWLAGAPGPRSRRFAMWSAAVVFILSLTGQGAAHLVRPGQQPPPALVVFITALPVIVLALIAILVHLRQADREEAAEAERIAAEAERQAAAERAENDERAALQAEVAKLTEAVSAAQKDRAEARAEAQKLAVKVEALTRKLAGNGSRKPAGNTTRKRGGNDARKPAGSAAASTPETTPGSGPETASDLDREALVLKYLSEGKSASAAGRLAGLSDSRGRQIARELARTAPQDVADGDGTA